MLGLADGWIALAYILSILSTLLCVIYGIANWHHSDEKNQVIDDWEKKDIGIENGK